MSDILGLTQLITHKGQYRMDNNKLDTHYCNAQWRDIYIYKTCQIQRFSAVTTWQVFCSYVHFNASTERRYWGVVRTEADKRTTSVSPSVA